MNDFSNVLWAYGGDYFNDGKDVGRMGSNDPGDPVLDSDEAIAGGRLLQPARRRSRIPAASAGTGTGLGAAFARRPDGDVRRTGTSSPPATRRASSRARSATRALPRGPEAARVHVRRHRHRHQRAPPSEREQKAAWLFVNWATSKKTQLANLKSKVGGGTPTRDSVYKLPEVEKAKKPPS